MNATITDEMHERQAKAVAKAVAGLMAQLKPKGFQPRAIAEGAIDGAVVALMASGLGPGDIALLLKTMAGMYAELAAPKQANLQ